MNKLSLMDVKQAIWDTRFQELFPEYKEQLKQFLKDPGCACNVKLLRQIMREKDRLKQYFPTKEITTPEEDDEALNKNEWVVINCPIDQLEAKLKMYPKSKRMVAAARWRDKVTVVLNDVEALTHIPSKTIQEHMSDSKGAELNWRVINTAKDDLIHELRKMPTGRKTFALTRWQDQITLIVNDLMVLF